MCLYLLINICLHHKVVIYQIDSLQDSHQKHSKAKESSHQDYKQRPMTNVPDVAGKAILSKYYCPKDDQNSTIMYIYIYQALLYQRTNKDI